METAGRVATAAGTTGSRAMPSVYDLKPRFQALLRPLGRRMAVAGIRANQVTVAAFLISRAPRP